MACVTKVNFRDRPSILTIKATRLTFGVNWLVDTLSWSEWLQES